MLDKKDDPKAGVKSSALLFGKHARLILSFLGGAFVLGLVFIGLLTGQKIPFYLLGVLPTAVHIGWQITGVDFDDADSCMQRFKSNGGQLGYIIWFGMLTGYAAYDT